MKEKKVIYYRDERDDVKQFETIRTKTVDKDFDYERKGIGNWLLRNVLVRCCILPVVFLLKGLLIRSRFVGRKALRKHKGSCFIYGNHTEPVPDACRAAIAPFPKTSYIIVHPNNVSIPGLQPLMMALGCIPIPTNPNGMKNFMRAVEKRSEKHPIVIFPERVIWPYYTKIRRFDDVSFRYPVKYGKPVFTMTVTYQKRRFSDKPRKTVYFDGPFYPDETLPPKERQEKLCRIAYETMCGRAKNSTYEYYEYVQKDDETAKD